MQVRRVRSDEWARLREIRLTALQDSPDAFGSTWATEAVRTDAEWLERARLSALSSDRSMFVAVADDGRWVGLAGGYRPGDPPADLELVSMWVAPDARGRGVGRLLVEAVLAWAEAGGAATVGLWVTRGNDTATALYERMGFRATGEAQPLPSNPAKDEVRMLRSGSVAIA